MSYPTHWQSIITKLQDFRYALKPNRFKRNTVRITIDHTHNRFRDNKRRTVIDLESSEMEEITDLIAEIFKEKELELEAKIKDYESREQSRK